MSTERMKLAIEALAHIEDIAHGRDQLDGFPRSRDEKQRRLGEISVHATETLAALRAPEADKTFPCPCGCGRDVSHAPSPSGAEAVALASFIKDNVEVDVVIGNDNPIVVNSLALAEAILAAGFASPKS